jgi:uncharacterized damage-inducible protein DinB
MSTPDELVTTAPERPALEAFLEQYRAIVVRKVRGVSDEDARRRLVGSLTTLGGLLKHLRQVEFDWFHTVLAQRSESELPITPLPDDPPNVEFMMGPEDTLEGLIADYQTACAHSRGIAAEYSLDYAAPHRGLGQVSLRWIYIHLIEETARHAGHIDILRELIDGKTGFDDID